MTKLSYTKYSTIIKNLIRDYLDGYLTYSNYIDKATEVYDLAWNDKNVNTDEYAVLTLLVKASSVVYDECNDSSINNDKETILDAGVDGFKPKICPYNTDTVEAEWELEE